MSVVHTRLDDNYIKTLDQLAKAKGSTRSKEIREAIKIFLADYTGEPNINSIEKRLRELESNFNELKAELKGKGMINGL